MRKEGSVIALASGKGGTGKSFLATNLAVAMSRRGLRTALVDCDFGLGNAHLLLGVNPRLSVQHFLQGKASMAEVVQPTPYGPELVPGGSGISQLAELSDQEILLLAEGLSDLAAERDVLVFDASAGMSAQSIATLLAAHQVILVTNPEIAALTDAYALIKCLSSQSRCPTIQIVVNRVEDPAHGRATFEKLADVARRFIGCSIHYLGEVPEDPAVTQRRLGQPPLLVSNPSCQTSRAVLRILDNMTRAMGGLGPRQTNPLESLCFRLRKGCASS